MKIQFPTKPMLIIGCFLVLNSCIETMTCEESLNSIKNDHMNMVLLKLDNPWRGFRKDFTGTDINNGKLINFKSNSLSYPALNDYTEIGDTLKKNRGSNIIFLMKKDSIIVFEIFCEDVYEHEKRHIFHRPLSKDDSLAIEKLNQKE